MLFKSNETAKNVFDDLDTFKSFSYCARPSAVFEMESELSIEYGGREEAEIK